MLPTHTCITRPQCENTNFLTWPLMAGGCVGRYSKNKNKWKLFSNTFYFNNVLHEKCPDGFSYKATYLYYFFLTHNHQFMYTTSFLWLPDLLVRIYMYVIQSKLRRMALTWFLNGWLADYQKHALQSPFNYFVYFNISFLVRRAPCIQSQNYLIFSCRIIIK